MPAKLWRARALKAVLREALKSTGVSAREAARRLHVSHTWVNDQLAADKPAPSAADVSRILTAIDIPVAQYNRIVAMAESAGSDWMIGGTPGINPQLAAVLACEQDPALIRITECAPTVFPGLLQTREYAHRIITRNPADLAEFEIQTRVMLRIARAEAITRKRAPIEFHALIGLPAIRGGIGGPQVMADQLEHVLGMAQRDNITVQAVDLAGEFTFAHAGAWILYEFDDLPAAVYFENVSSSAVLVEEDDVAAHKSAAEALRREAMSPTETLELIASVIPRDMETK
jgi:transcriptional regulator with XRE-family HTH domain